MPGVCISFLAACIHIPWQVGSGRSGKLTCLAPVRQLSHEESISCCLGSPARNPELRYRCCCCTAPVLLAKAPLLIILHAALHLLLTLWLCPWCSHQHAGDCLCARGPQWSGQDHLGCGGHRPHLRHRAGCGAVRVGPPGPQLDRGPAQRGPRGACGRVCAHPVGAASSAPVHGLHAQVPGLQRDFHEQHSCSGGYQGSSREVLRGHMSPMLALSLGSILEAAVV